MQRAVGWLAMALSLSGVAIQSLLPELTRYSFIVFLIAACLWLADGLLRKNRPLVCTQVVLIILNTIGAIRWLT